MGTEAFKTSTSFADGSEGKGKHTVPSSRPRGPSHPLQTEKDPIIQEAAI